MTTRNLRKEVGLALIIEGPRSREEEEEEEEVNHPVVV